MELLEYQAKQLFQEVGIPTLSSQIIAHSRELKQLQIPYPIVLKSQVRAGGRGKAGGIQLVENTIDAIAAARNIFNLSILGQYPEVLLAEAHYDREQEIFLAVVLDYALQRPVLLGSAYGGMDVEKLLENIHQITIEDFFSSYHARHLLHKMGIKGELVPAISTILEKMYDLLLNKDLELVEINPLGINSDGELMALDGKVTVSEYAIHKHQDLLLFGHQRGEVVDLESDQPLYWEHDAAEGSIGIISYGVGSAALIWDLLHEHQGHPACCWILGPSSQRRPFSPEKLNAQMATVLAQLRASPQIKLLLLNLVADEAINQQILQNLSIESPQGKKVVDLSLEEERQNRPTATRIADRTRGTQSEELQDSHFPEIVVRCIPHVEPSPELSIQWESDLEKAVRRAIALATQ